MEFGNAIEIFEKYGMKPALADTLMTFYNMFNLRKNISPEDAEKRDNCMMKAMNLEKEMCISVDRRSALLQII